MIMYDAFNTPAHPAIEVDDREAVRTITEMANDVPVYVRAFAGHEGGENVTVFWTLTGHGEVGTIFEHTRENAFSVPVGHTDSLVEGLRFFLEDTRIYTQYDRDAEYATGE